MFDYAASKGDLVESIFSIVARIISREKDNTSSIAGTDAAVYVYIICLVAVVAISAFWIYQKGTSVGNMFSR